MVQFFNTNYSHSQPWLATGSKPRMKKKKKKNFQKEKNKASYNKLYPIYQGYEFII